MADTIKKQSRTDSAASNTTSTKVNSIERGSIADDGEEQATEDAPYSLTIILPHKPGKLEFMVSSHEQVHEIRQAITEFPIALQYSCFHLEHKGERLNDFIPISEMKDIGSGSEIHLVEDPYTEKDARLHMIRVRELIGASGDRTDAVHGILSGMSLFEKVAAGCGDVVYKANQKSTEIEEFHFTGMLPMSSLLPEEQEPAPKTVKAICLSSWNPPPAHLRQKGHLLYLMVTTYEGEQFQITCHTGGFFVNKSSNAKFDPFPRQTPKSASAHSLLTLIGKISPSFNERFGKLQEYNNRREPLATFQITNALPPAPWVVPCAASPIVAHSPDFTRTQEAFLISGADGTDTLRDWNEEFQSAKELPKDSVQDRVFRERLLAKLYADYNDAAARGAVAVARGEVAPLNPTEGRDAQIFVYNNIFFSFGADGVGTFASEGGDEAARVATGMDCSGAKAVNQYDIDGLYTPGTVLVDYLGKRIVGQSIVPGIFKQREPGENQIDYGAVDGKDVIAADERFAAPLAKLSMSMKVKKHAVWDKNGKRFDLEASVETKGLLGTDGRKYILDLYRITPLDIAWLEEMAAKEINDYPHRMTVLRSELVELYHRQKLREWLNVELAQRADAKKADTGVEDKPAKDKPATKNDVEKKKIVEKAEEKTGVETEEEGEEKVEDKTEKPRESIDAKDDRIDAHAFKFALNPDVFSGQVPQTEEEKAEVEADEKEVRAACAFLRETSIPELLNDLRDSDASFPLDGLSLRNLLHKRGINMRYLGKIAMLSEGSRLQSMREICVRDMIVRSFKHVAAKHLRYLPLPLTSACSAHLLNCLLGAEFNPKPTADVDLSLRNLYSEADFSFETVTPESLREFIEGETARRFRYKLDSEWQTRLSHVQVLREVCLKLGFQVQCKEYAFTADTNTQDSVSDVAPLANDNGESRKKKKFREGSPFCSASPPLPHTFTVDDIVNVVPIVKDSSPRSSLAEEALEAGRISIAQNQRKLGQELLLESLSLYEQVHGILHPEVARVYHQISMIYFQLDEKEAAVELARKAIIVAERTLGVDSQETLLDYLNLSLFLHQLGNSRTAFEYSKHALRLWRNIFGPDHPDTITAINNAAVMLQHLKAYHESRRWFEESLRICDKVFGKQSINSATLQFQLAQALALDNDSKGAVNRMRESYNIFLQELGADDKNTKEAESWLEQLTQNAVSIARHIKDQETRRLRAGIKFTPRNLPAQRGAVGATRTDAAVDVGERVVENKPSIDSRSIDELIRFIEGISEKKKSGSKKTVRKNPKTCRTAK